MDNNSFTPSGQGSPNNMTPQPTPEPIPNTKPAPASDSTAEPTPEQSPVSVPEPTAPEPVVPEPTTPEPVAPTSEPTTPSIQPTPEPSPESSMSSAAVTPIPEPTKKPQSKLLIILCACMGVLALLAVVLFAIPFGNNGTLWNTITGGNGTSGSNGGNSGNGSNGTRQTGDTVITGDYTYTANLDLQYEPKGVFHDGLMEVITADGDIAYVDTSGNIAFTLDLSYEPRGDFGNGLLAVRCNANRTKTKPSYTSEGNIEKNAIVNRDEINNRTYGYIDKTGALAIPCQYYSADNFKNGYAAVVALQDKEAISSNSVIDPTGQTVVPAGKYSNIVYEDNTFKDGVFKSGYPINPDTNEYGWGCFNLNGDQLSTLDDRFGTCATDTDKEAIQASIQAKLGDTDNYHVGTPSEGLVAVSQREPMSMFFVDTDGNTVWTVDIDKVIDADEEEYTEGLIPIAMWTGDGERPSIETLMEGGISNEELYRNGGIVYYDHSGQPVFIYRYSTMLDNANNE